MKTIQTLLAGFILLAATMGLSAQCNSTFSYQDNGNYVYTFAPNQVEQQGYTYNYTWNFSTGAIFNTPTAVEQFYNGAGNYLVCLTVSEQNSQGVNLCTDSTCITIVVPPVTTCFPNLYFSDQQNGATTQFSFTNNITDYTNTAINWDFGDGTQLTGVAAPTHSFAGYGQFNVCFFATDTLTHCSNSYCASVSVDSCPQYYLEGSQPSSNSTNLIFYSDLPTGYSPIWNFGDGSEPDTTVYSPTHTFPAYGEYLVCLSISIPGCHTSVCDSINVDSCNTQLYAYFNWVQPVDGRDSVVFSSYLASGETFTWNFGDNSSTTQTDSGSVSHVFPSLDTIYNVCLSVGNGACQVSNCATIALDSCSQWDVNYQWSPDYYIANTIDFSASYPLYNLDISNVQWTYGDGTSDSGFSVNPHTYPGFGNYVACFSVNINGCGTMSQCDTIPFLCNLAATFYTQQIASNSIEYLIDTLPTYAGEVYHWTFGDGASDNTEYPVHVYALPGNYTTCLTVTDTLTGCTATTFCTNDSAAIWNDTICGHVWVDANLNGVQDSGEANYQACLIYISVAGGTPIEIYTDSNGDYSLVVATDSILIGTGFYTSAQITMPVNGYGYSYSFPQANMRQCGFDFGVVTNCGTIEGAVYAELYNGYYGYPGGNIPNQVIDVNGQPTAVSTINGFSIMEPAGAYTVTLDPSSYYAGQFTVAPTQTQAVITAPGAASSDNNFAVDMPYTYNDLGIDIIPNNPLIPGDSAHYQVMVTNYGPNAQTVNYNFNTPAPLNLANSNGGTAFLNSVEWNSPQILAFNSFLSQPVYYVDYTTPINTDVYDTASLINFVDTNQANNSDTCHQITVSSFDPNHKLASQSGNGPMGLIRKNQELKYVINFQNTGTSAAVNVVVKDAVDANLDFSTFRYIGSQSGITPDIRITNNTLYFRFSNILLPDSGRSQAGSKSWVAFSIKPKVTVRGGTQIHNNADIFFDYNSAVRTNTTLHTIEGPTDVQNLNGDGKLFISPNPFVTQTTIRLQNMPFDHYNYQVTDMLGRVVTQGLIDNNQTLSLARGGMSAGAYLISFYDNNGIAKRAKIVVQ